jgi:hypothetical protein
VLGVPAVRAAALLNSNTEPTPQGNTKDLVVAFAGPFCYWQESPTIIKVMAPPVGPNYMQARHQPWAGTTANEKMINVSAGTGLTLAIDGYVPPQTPTQTGTKAFLYEQGTGTGLTPLFNLFVPVPNVIIGVRQTAVMMACTPGTEDPYCKEYMVFASGLSFLYKNVNVDGVAINQGPVEFFKPCFKNDASLQDATLGVHLTPLNRNPDPDHTHAKLVWTRMLGMYPWMAGEITGIDFCPNFNAAVCDFDPKLCTPGPKHHGDAAHGKKGPLTVLVGPGNDCEVPIMGLGLPGSPLNINKKKRKY